jgi:hypothetical protein
MGYDANIREESRKHYTSWRASDKTGISFEALNAGSLQRIADACEKMCIDRETLEGSVARWRGQCHMAEVDNAALKRSNAALRGVITKLKARNA